jgi:hypothetical protein
MAVHLGVAAAAPRARGSQSPDEGGRRSGRFASREEAVLA